MDCMVWVYVCTRALGALVRQGEQAYSIYFQDTLNSLFSNGLGDVTREGPCTLCLFSARAPQRCS